MSTPSTSVIYPLVSLLWWQDLLLRAWRQAYQTALPILTVAVTSGHIEPQTLVITLVGAEGVTVFKFLVLQLVGISVPPDVPLWVKAIDRAFPAAAGVLSGVAVASWTDFLTVDWTQTGYAAALAALISLLGMYADPPAPHVDVQTVPVDPAAPASGDAAGSV